MSKPKVLVGAVIADSVKAYLEQFSECEYLDMGKMTRDELLGRLADIDGVIIFGTKVDVAFFVAAPKLKAVCNVSVGFNNVDIEEAKKRGVTVTNTPGVLDETVADLIMALMLSSARRIAELDGYVRAGSWKPTDGTNLYGLDVHHKKLGIIGMGRIGEAVARRAKNGFSMSVSYCNRNRKPDTETSLGAVFQEMDTLLAESDFIVLMTPLTDETRKMIGKREFALMKKTAFFINASRGQTVDEAALIEALQNGTIAGAGLDVFEYEPVSPDNPLLVLKNAVLTPHLGSATHQTRNEMALLAAKNLELLLQGKPALTPV